MKIETLNDILKWTQQFHQELSVCMKHCADRNESMRAKMLLDYLSDHEKTLATVFEGFPKQRIKMHLIPGV